MNPICQIYVFDTYARTAARRILHFDAVLAENEPWKALEAARDWRHAIGEATASVNTENRAYCHSGPTAPPAMLAAIRARGYAIFKREGCPK